MLWLSSQAKSESWMGPERALLVFVCQLYGITYEFVWPGCDFLVKFLDTRPKFREPTPGGPNNTNPLSAP